VFAATLARGSGKSVGEFVPRWGGEGSKDDAIVETLTRLARKG
jgi:hypothetical protein